VRISPGTVEFVAVARKIAAPPLSERHTVLLAIVLTRQGKGRFVHYRNLPAPGPTTISSPGKDTFARPCSIRAPLDSFDRQGRYGGIEVFHGKLLLKESSYDKSRIE
jgi:hypothetical protein